MIASTQPPPPHPSTDEKLDIVSEWAERLTERSVAEIRDYITEDNKRVALRQRMATAAAASSSSSSARRNRGKKKNRSSSAGGNSSGEDENLFANNSSSNGGGDGEKGDDVGWGRDDDFVYDDEIPDVGTDGRVTARFDRAVTLKVLKQLTYETTSAEDEELRFGALRRAITRYEERPGQYFVRDVLSGMLTVASLANDILAPAPDAQASAPPSEAPTPKAAPTMQRQRQRQLHRKMLEKSRHRLHRPSPRESAKARAAPMRRRGQSTRS